MKKDKIIIYYPDPHDYIWNEEIQKIMPYCFGKGLDVGCGGRSINKEIKRLDIDPENKPDIVASADNIPVKNASFDYLIAQHLFEHFEDQEKLLKEFARVIRPGGYILIVHPDVEFTKKQTEEKYNPETATLSHNKHFHEVTQAQFGKFIKSKQKLGFKVLEIGKAYPTWSFYVILRVNKDHSPTLSKSPGQDDIEAKT